MKSWLWIILVFVITVVCMNVFKIPIFVSIIIFAPLLLIGLTYASFTYSFRASLQPQPVPESGYGTRISALEQQGHAVSALGFEVIDAFYLKMVPDVVLYAFRHQTEPVYFCVYHLGSKMTCDFVTPYERDASLTTSASVEGGMSPRPPGSLLQIFPNAPYAALFDEHMKAHAFITGKRIRAEDISNKNFREYFMTALMKSAAHIRTYALWPIRLIVWTITKRGRIYCKSIEEQYKAGMITVS